MFIEVMRSDNGAHILLNTQYIYLIRIADEVDRKHCYGKYDDWVKSVIVMNDDTTFYVINEYRDLCKEIMPSRD